MRAVRSGLNGSVVTAYGVLYVANFTANRIEVMSLAIYALCAWMRVMVIAFAV